MAPVDLVVTARRSRRPEVVGRVRRPQVHRLRDPAHTRARASPCPGAPGMKGAQVPQVHSWRSPHCFTISIGARFGAGTEKW
jgi:hypothetical protein